MQPGNRPITIYQGDDYTHTVTLTSDGTTAVNITGRTYTAQVRTAADVLTLTFTCTVPVGSDGRVVITAADTLTAALSATPAAAGLAWSLHEQTAGGQDQTLLEGPVSVRARVTH